MTGAPVDAGITQSLIQAGAFGTAFMGLGSAIAWLVNRWDQRRARAQSAAEQAEAKVAKAAERAAEETLEERQFYDQRARAEIERLERERDTARAECHAAQLERERLVRQVYETREAGLVCLHEAARCQQTLISMHLACERPAPPFDPLPDPRKISGPV